jgi:hypothetical protein
VTWFLETPGTHGPNFPFRVRLPDNTAPALVPMRLNKLARPRTERLEASTDVGARLNFPVAISSLRRDVSTAAK